MTGGESTTSQIYTWNSYANYTSEQCLALSVPADEVLCSSQMLNVTNPPSIYGFVNYTQLWEPVSCLLWNVTLGDRVNVQGEVSPVRFFDALISLAFL